MIEIPGATWMASCSVACCKLKAFGCDCVTNFLRASLSLSSVTSTVALADSDIVVVSVAAAADWRLLLCWAFCCLMLSSSAHVCFCSFVSTVMVLHTSFNFLTNCFILSSYYDLSCSSVWIELRMASSADWVPDDIKTVECVALSSSITSLVGTFFFCCCC